MIEPQRKKAEKEDSLLVNRLVTMLPLPGVETDTFSDGTGALDQVLSQGA